MGLFETPQAPTVYDIVSNIKQINVMAFRQRVQFVKNTFDMVWNNQLFTAAEVVKALSIDALLMFTEHSIEQQNLARIADEAKDDRIKYTMLVPTHKITPVLDINNNPTGELVVDMTQPYGG